MVDLRNRFQWGQSVTIQNSSVGSAVYEEFAVFDSGNNLFTVPQVVTLTLDLTSTDGTEALWTSDDLWWAKIEVGLGGYRRTFEIDWYNGQQASFAANSIRVIARRLSGTSPRPVKARASVAVGARSSNAKPPTWTSASLLPLAGGTSLLAPKHAKSFRLIGAPAQFDNGMTIIQAGPSPQSIALLTAAEVHDLMVGKYEYPVNAKQQTFAAAIGHTGDIRVAYSLDL